MSHLQIRNVPEDLHRRLRARAALEGVSVSDLLLREAERLMARPTQDDVLARLASRELVLTAETSAEALRSARDER
ncbi:FitA-like ribbon-helix-helix domain-containing protein [Serinicoccus kebangsaanensis]|uniref:FitA-like ribbon-helix-helix domain-containing protein n=1 Tax=Serinicoccus kebangsaanensis TaxID=2602069 RepID=UPI00124D45A4|nr:hypothetical protein [Serinicoccus kebangsaanensis]